MSEQKEWNYWAWEQSRWAPFFEDVPFKSKQVMMRIPENISTFIPGPADYARFFETPTDDAQTSSQTSFPLLPLTESSLPTTQTATTKPSVSWMIPDAKPTSLPLPSQQRIPLKKSNVIPKSILKTTTTHQPPTTPTTPKPTTPKPKLTTHTTPKPTTLNVTPIAPTEISDDEDDNKSIIISSKKVEMNKDKKQKQKGKKKSKQMEMIDSDDEESEEKEEQEDEEEEEEEEQEEEQDTRKRKATSTKPQQDSVKRRKDGESSTKECSASDVDSAYLLCTECDPFECDQRAYRGRIAQLYYYKSFHVGKEKPTEEETMKGYMPEAKCIEVLCFFFLWGLTFV